MKNIVVRTITGVLLVFIILGSILWSTVLFALLFLVITILALWEFYTLAEQDRQSPQKLIGVVAGSLLFLSFTLYSMEIISLKLMLVTIPILFSLFIFELFNRKEQPIANLAITFLGIIYIALPFSMLNSFFYWPFTRHESHPSLLVGFFIITWLGDTAAYLFGKNFGKHKLFERISPKKTWEGFIAGAIVSMLTALVVSYFDQEFQLINWIIIALIIIIFGTLGDLIESKFKRSLDIKDSGNLLPGHGGILDRFDTVLLSAPFVYFYIVLLN